MKRELPAIAFDHLNHRIAPGSKFMEHFEHVKSDFGLDNTQDIFRLPLNIGIGGARCISPYYDAGTFALSRRDLQSLFDPVILKIISLVNSQIIAAGKECEFSVINVSTPLSPLPRCNLQKKP